MRREYKVVFLEDRVTEERTLVNSCRKLIKEWTWNNKITIGSWIVTNLPCKFKTLIIGKTECRVYEYFLYHLHIFVKESQGWLQFLCPEQMEKGSYHLCERRYGVLWIQYELLFCSLMTVFTLSLRYTDMGLIWVTWATQAELKWVWIFLKCFLGKVECEEVFEDGTRFANVQRLKSAIERDLIPSFIIFTF